VATFNESAIIDAPVDEVWTVLADIGTISTWNPGVKDSHQTTGGNVEKGACRHCDLGGKNYLIEEVVTFEPTLAITFRITDTNLPFKAADIRFTLTEDRGATSVTVSPIYELKFGVVGKLLDTLIVQPTYRKGMKELLRGLKSHVEGSAP
jgi:hypothetical protein